MGMNEKLIEVFTHWIVSTENEIKKAAQLLLLTSCVVAVFPAEEPGNLVILTDQAGWDALYKYEMVFSYGLGGIRK